MDLFLVGNQLGDQLLAFGPVKADPAACHVVQDGEGFCFKVEDGFDFILTHADLKGLPQFQCERCVLFRILSHIHGGEFPKFFFWMNSEVRSGLFEPLL